MRRVLLILILFSSCSKGGRLADRSDESYEGSWEVVSAEAAMRIAGDVAIADPTVQIGDIWAISRDRATINGRPTTIKDTLIFNDIGTVDRFLITGTGHKYRIMNGTTDYRLLLSENDTLSNGDVFQQKITFNKETK